MLDIKKTLPEETIGRAGCDLFSSRKDLTVVMIPFERFSHFAKAVDDLYAAVDVPFNLIVIEGNAPDSVRSQLEKRQSRHKNMAIIYSDHPVSIGGAINLATPHLTTPYVFVMDNDARIPKGDISKMLQRVKENPLGIVCPEYNANAAGLGIRTCFLTSQTVLNKLGKFDENSSPFTVGIDLRMAADDLGFYIENETSAHMEVDHDVLWPIDVPLHSFQWNEQRVRRSFASLKEKWGISLPEKEYDFCLARKKKDLEECKNVFSFLNNLITKWTHPGEREDSVFVTQKAA